MTPLAAPIAVLVGLLAWECLPAPEDPVAAPQTVAAIVAGAPVVTPPVPAWTEIALARPLFAPDRRRPPNAPGARESLPRLTGTIRSDGTWRAIFAGAGAAAESPARSVVVRNGDAIAGWTVAEIADGAATLERGGRRVTLRLSFGNAPVATLIEQPKGLVLLHDKHTSPFLQP
jgi:hypothetical protein